VLGAPLPPSMQSNDTDLVAAYRFADVAFQVALGQLGPDLMAPALPNLGCTNLGCDESLSARVCAVRCRWWPLPPP
jgi:hypothetical protein